MNADKITLFVNGPPSSEIDEQRQK